MRIGIVGAGIAGLACAEGLTRQGHEVVVFDKGRGPGGRMSTRRLETPHGMAYFDHGAQYFTVRDDDFAAQVRVWAAQGVVADWPAAGSGAYVGVPAMNAPIRWLAGRHDVRFSALVSAVERRGDRWRVHVAEDGAHDVDLLVTAIPAEQTATLLARAAAGPAARARTAVSEPCWTAMAAFGHPVPVDADCRTGSQSGDAVLGWAARNSAKPGRTGPESWIVQATPEWSRRHIDAGRDEVVPVLLTALSDDLGVDLPPRIGAAAHLWRYARCASGGGGEIVDHAGRLGVCGDWVIGPRVESAWVSGARLARRIADAGVGG